MEDSHSVAIFWDYENCHPGSNVTGYEVANAIRTIAHQYGALKQFKAYFEVSEQPSTKSPSLRSELQSSGVSLTDCPHNGRKDVADKMILVDMLAFALDNVAPATAILISGDRDFAYAASILRHRRYRVVLVAPSSTHISLRSQASAVLDWNEHVLDKCPSGQHDVVSDSSLRSSSQGNGGKKPTPAATGFFSPIPPPTSTSKSMRRTSPGTTSAPLRQRRGSSSQSAEAGSRTPFVPPRRLPDDLNKGFERFTTNDPLLESVPSFKPSFGAEPSEGRKQSAPFAANFDRVRATESYVTSTTVSNWRTRSGDDASGTTATRPRPDFGTRPRSCTVPSNVPETIVPGRRTARKSSTPSFLVSNLSPVFSPTRALDDAGPPFLVGSSHVFLSEAARSSRCPEPPEVPDGTSAANTRVASTSSLSDDGQLAQQTPLPLSPSSTGSRSEVQPNSIVTPDSTCATAGNFLPLVDQLKRLRSGGNDRPLRSLVGQTLVTEHPDIYQQAGVQGFGQYAALAQSLGWVELGGKGGKDWICLKV